MSKHLGRNPFQKKTAKIIFAPEQKKSALIDYLLIDLPAKSYMLALQWTLLVKDTFRKK